jgi:HTH-type transcriptional regulator, sugar sensing transcriptional regulator
MTSLCDLGLSSYEEKAYRGLLTLRSGTAEEISEASDVPMGRIYDVLSSLESQNVVRRQPDRHPRTYVAVEPDRAVDRLLTARRRDLHRQQTQYETVAAEVLSELETIAPVEGHFWPATVGQNEIAELLADRLDAATNNLVITATTTAGGLFGFEEVYTQTIDRLTDTLDRDVSVRFLFTNRLVTEMPNPLVTELDQLLDVHENFELRTTAKLYNTYDVVDEKNICVYVANPFDQNSILGTVQVTNENIVQFVQNQWQPRWEAASSLESS